MKINWFTVIAQVINFLILVWLLKRFLYKPVLDAIDEREKKIVSRLEDAKTKEEAAKKEADEFRKKNEAFDGQKKAAMDKTVADAKVKNDQLTEDARIAAVALLSKQQKAFIDSQGDLKKALAQKTQQEVFEISRKTLADLASVSLEEQSAKLFISRLEDLKDGGKQQFIDCFKSGSVPVLIQSAFELPSAQRTEIKKVVDEITGVNTAFEFSTTPEIISGIEMTANGYKIGWSISAYLDLLQRNIFETIKEKKDMAPPAINAPAIKQDPEKVPEPEKNN